MLSLKELCLINIPLNRYNFDNKDYFYLMRLVNLNYDKYNENIKYEDKIKFYIKHIMITEEMKIYISDCSSLFRSDDFFPDVDSLRFLSELD